MGQLLREQRIGFRVCQQSEEVLGDLDRLGELGQAGVDR